MTGRHGGQTQTLYDDGAVHLARGVDVSADLRRDEEEGGLAGDGASKDDDEGDDTEGTAGEFCDDVVATSLAWALVVSLHQTEDVPRRRRRSDGESTGTYGGESVVG